MTPDETAGVQRMGDEHETVVPTPVSAEQIKFMAEAQKQYLKSRFFELRDYLQAIKNSGMFDGRALSIAITELETAQMWAVRSLYSDEQRQAS